MEIGISVNLDETVTTPAPHTGIADARKETQIQKGRVSEPRGTIHSLSVHSPG